MAQQYQFGRVPDSAILSLLKALVADQADGTWSISTLDHSQIEGKYDQVVADPWKKVLNSSSYLINRASASADSIGLKFTYYRAHTYGRSPNGGQGWIRGDHPFVDGIQIEGPSGNKAQLTVISALNKFLGMAPPAGLSSEGSAALDQSSALINRVSEAILTLTEHTADRQRDLDATRSSLEEQANERLSDLKRVLEEQYRARMAELEDRDKYLDHRASQLDDRENTHVRRELQIGMANLSDTTLSRNLLSKSNGSFLQVVIPTIIIAIILASGAIYQGVAVSQNPPNIANALLFAEIRTVVLGIGAGALIWFVVRLAGNRYNQVMRWEQNLHRFRLDTERASFLVEGDLEARKVNEQGLPEVLLDRFSRGLFSDGQSDESDEDEVGSTLAQLLSRAASVKVGTEGVTVEVDKAGVRKARRASRANTD